jgi:hypothetical protein
VRRRRKACRELGVVVELGELLLGSRSERGGGCSSNVDCFYRMELGSLAAEDWKLR